MRNNIAAQLDTVHSVIGSALASCAKTNKSAELKKELNTATQAISKTVAVLQASPKARSLIKTRKSLVAIANTMASLSEGLASRELSVKDFRAVCANLQTKFIPNFVTSLANEVTALPESETEEVADVPAEVLPKAIPHVRASLSNGKLSLAEQLAGLGKLRAAADPLDPDPEDYEESDDEKAERVEREREYDRLRREGVEDVSSLEVLNILRAKRSLLPLRLAKLSSYAVVKLPLVPIFPDNFKITEERNLKRLGFKHTIIQGYAFLEDQLVLCVSRTEIDKLNHVTTKQSNEKVQGNVKIAKGLHDTAEQRAEALTAKLTEYSAELADTITKMAKREAAVRPLIAKQKKAEIEIRKLSKPEYDKLIAAALSKKAKLSELSDSDVAKLRIIHTSTPHVRPTPAELKAMKDDGVRHDALEAHQAAIRQTLKERAAADKASLKKADRKVLDALKEEWKELELKLRPVRAMQKKISDFKEMIANVRKEIMAQSEAIEKRYVAIRETKKGLKPKKEHVTPLDYANTVLAHINEISSSAYTLVTPDFKVNIRNADILCFWIMPAAKLNQFFRDAGGKTKVQWSFPWDA